MNSTQKTQVRFHFSQAGIVYPPQKLDEDFDGISYIETALSRCEWAYGQTTLAAGYLELEASQTVEQDIVVATVRPTSTTTTTYGDKTETERKRPSYRERLSEYHRQVEGLARALGVW